MTEPLSLALEALIRQVVRDELAKSGGKPGVPGRRLWISSSEAAREVGVKVSTIRSWIKRERLQASLVPGTRGYRIRVADWEAFCSGAVQRAEAQPPNAADDNDDLTTTRALAMAREIRGGRG